MKNDKIICTGNSAYNYITKCVGISNGIKENIIYEINNFNDFITKKAYAVCPINEKIIVAISYFKKDNKIKTTCMLNLEKVDLEKDKIDIDNYKKYYYKKYTIQIDVTTDTWENTVVITGKNVKEIIYGDTSADSPKELQNKDYLNMLIKAKKFVDKN